MTYFVSAPHPPSERRTDAGQLPPWLLGVAFVRGRCPVSHRAACRTIVSVSDETSAETLLCSAKGCRADAVWVLAWNNPKIHTPERRKTWLACDEHREHLSQFLGVRGFLKDVVTLAEWESSAADR